MHSTTNIRNIGILAHVDAGKTTLTEQLLYKSGSIRALGSVDKGTAHTDSLEVEKQRGISVKSADVMLSWKDTNIHIIDTPGHIDFSAEVERTLRVLDGAVLVISAVEGIQPQTELYFQALKAMKIPTIFFINKIDRVGAEVASVLKEIKLRLTDTLVETEEFYGEETQEPKVLSFEKLPLVKDIYVEQLANYHDVLLEKYLGGVTITGDEFNSTIKALSKTSIVYPVLYGSSIKGIGVEELLNALVDYLPCPKGSSEDELSAVVYKITQDKTLGKLAYVRIFNGKISTRELIKNNTKGIESKVTQIKKLIVGKQTDCNELLCGELGILAGLSSFSIGDIIGSPENVPSVPSLATPLLTLQVYPENTAVFVELVEALQKLEEEDPLLKVKWIKEKKEVHINIMGLIQQEIIQGILLERFNIKATFGKPSVIYKETPASSSWGFEAYTMPKPCWAIVKFLFEPLPKGSGLVFESKVRTEDIKLRYQRELENHLPKALEQGLLGWQVVDLKVTLISGEDHVMHSRPGDFIIATSIAIMDGLSNTLTTLLEPILNFTIMAPEATAGKILGDLVNMRANFESPVISNGTFIVKGLVPAATSLEYGIRLGIITAGKGTLSTSFSDYEPCPIELGATNERIGVNPLDRAKFILNARNALG